MSSERTQILVLNYNGRALLDECLPSVLEAARRTPGGCGVVVVDNDSTDGSREWLGLHWPEVRVIRQPNLGLASFNAVLAELDEPIVLLLNNDVKLDPNAVAPLLDVFDRHADALFAAPAVLDVRRLALRGHADCAFGRGSVWCRGCLRVPGHEAVVDRPDLTAAAGPVLAVDRIKFLKLGGYDALFHPGRIEDLDLGFRAWMAGGRGYYVPESLAYHKGFGTFAPVLGDARCDGLAMRNTLIFTWKNLQGARLIAHLLLAADPPGRARWSADVGRSRSAR